MGERAARATILVVSNGGTEMLDSVLRSYVCNIMRTDISNAPSAVQRFIEEFNQGIPVAIVCGHLPDQASVIAAQLKHVCAGIRVIALSERVGHPTQDADREYDVIIPHNSADLRDMMDAFLGLND